VVDAAPSTVRVANFVSPRAPPFPRFDTFGLIQHSAFCIGPPVLLDEDGGTDREAEGGGLVGDSWECGILVAANRGALAGLGLRGSRACRWR